MLTDGDGTTGTVILVVTSWPRTLVTASFVVTPVGTVRGRTEGSDTPGADGAEAKGAEGTVGAETAVGFEIDGTNWKVGCGKENGGKENGGT